MNRKHFTLIVTIAVFSGLVGGGISNWLLVTQLVMAQDLLPKVIEAQEFRVVDAEGNVRANLRVDSRNMVSLLLKDVNELPRVLLAVDRGNPLLVLTHKEAEKIGFRDEGPSVQLWDADGNVRAVLGTTELKHLETGDLAP